MALSRKPIEIVEQGKHQLLAKAEHWERIFLSDVAHVQNGFAFKSDLFTHSEGMPLIRIRDIENRKTENFYSGEYSEEFIVRRGDILIGMDGDFNAAIWHGPDGLLNQRVCRIISATQGFSDKFLFLCLQPYLNAINAETSSVTVKHLSSKTIGEIPLPLPPLNEQYRIVAKIEELFSELDKGIDSLQTAREQLKVYRQSLLKHAFEGKLTAQWRAENHDKLETADALLKRVQHERAQRYQQQLAEWEAAGKPGSKPKVQKSLPPHTAEELAELPELPEGWVYTRVGTLIDDPAYGTSKKCDYGVEGIGVLRIPNVIAGRIDASDLKFAQFTPDEIASYKLNGGDVLLIRSNGSVSIVGRCALVSDSDVDYLYAGYLIRLRPNFSLVEPRFFLNTFSLHSIRKQIEKKAKSTSGVNNINTGEIQSLVIAMCSIAEQKQIQMEVESRLSEIDQLDQTITSSLQQAEALRQSILEKAFSGQLVAQDPADELASALLARIQAEKATQAVAAKLPKSRKTASTKTNVIPFPVKIPGIPTAELHAGIMALAYQRHEQSRKSWYFGHVKAEKISHMVESHLGIDLERKPIKDAAGPNDFQRLLAVEAMAREQNWFDVQKLPTGRHMLYKMDGFDGLIEKTSAVLGERLDSVNALIELFIPLDKIRSEIVATLYAAWNNLLLLGRKPSDEEIVLEATENWHGDKLEIRRERFFNCLAWMRSHELVPAGRGRYVAKKGELPT